ncbi:hypothetical protein MTHERMOG20_09520 [Moorella thermoacetica]|nr:hypothetical protein MTHERMOG20_09520 [Moorella thermoacetica]
MPGAGRNGFPGDGGAKAKPPLLYYSIDVPDLNYEVFGGAVLPGQWVS